jgi:hypothetical protein
VSVATKFEGTRIKKTEGRGGSEQPVVLVGLARDGVDGAAIDAQCAAQAGCATQDRARASADGRVVG